MVNVELISMWIVYRLRVGDACTYLLLLRTTNRDCLFPYSFKCIPLYVSSWRKAIAGKVDLNRGVWTLKTRISIEIFLINSSLKTNFWKVWQTWLRIELPRLRRSSNGFWRIRSSCPHLFTAVPLSLPIRSTIPSKLTVVFSSLPIA